jgi:hypothetical protein
VDGQRSDLGQRVDSLTGQVHELSGATRELAAEVRAIRAQLFDPQSGILPSHRERIVRLELCLDRFDERLRHVEARVFAAAAIGSMASGLVGMAIARAVWGG